MKNGSERISQIFKSNLNSIVIEETPIKIKSERKNLKINIERLNLLENVKNLKKKLLFSNLKNFEKENINKHMNGVLAVLQNDFSPDIEKTLRKYINNK